jgi:hypothetical protein
MKVVRESLIRSDSSAYYCVYRYIGKESHGLLPTFSLSPQEGSSGEPEPRAPNSVEFWSMSLAEDVNCFCGSSLLPLRRDVAAARSALQVSLLKKKIREKILIIVACL